MAQVNIINGFAIPEFSTNITTNKKILHENVQHFVREQLSQNPNITDEELQVQVSNYIDNITRGKKVGRAKILELGELPKTRQEIEQILTTQTQTAPKKISVNEISSDVARANSNMPLEVKPQGEKVEIKNVVEETSKKGTEPVIKEEPYQSVKKQKALKKQSELANKTQKQQARRNAGKQARNSARVQNIATVSTANSQIMSREARRTYGQIANIQNPLFKSAEESAKVFMKNGYKPIIKKNAEESAQVFMKNGKTWTELAFDILENFQNNLEKNVKPEVKEVEKEVVKEVVKEVPKEKVVEKEVVKEIVKEVPKNNKWAIGGAAVVGGLLTWIGTKIPAKKQSA